MSKLIHLVLVDRGDYDDPETYVFKAYVLKASAKRAAKTLNEKVGELKDEVRKVEVEIKKKYFDPNDHNWATHKDASKEYAEVDAKYSEALAKLFGVMKLNDYGVDPRAYTKEVELV